MKALFVIPLVFVLLLSPTIAISYYEQAPIEDGCSGGTVENEPTVPEVPEVTESTPDYKSSNGYGSSTKRTWKVIYEDECKTVSVYVTYQVRGCEVGEPFCNYQEHYDRLSTTHSC